MDYLLVCNDAGLLKLIGSQVPNVFAFTVYQTQTKHIESFIAILPSKWNYSLLLATVSTTTLSEHAISHTCAES